MRVVHVGTYASESTNGVEKAMAGLVRHLPAHAVDVEVWNPTQEVGALRTRVDNGVNIHDLPVYNKPKGMCVLRRQAREFVEVQTKSVDLFHFHSVFLRQNLKLGALDVPYVISPHGGYSREVLTGRNRIAKAIWLALWERPFLRRARMIHATSVPEADDIANLGLSVPVRYIPNGVDEALLTRDVPPPSHGADFVYLGRLAINPKGLDLLLRGYAKARATETHFPRLILAGPDFRGGLRQLTGMIRELGLQDNVALADPVFGEQKLDLISRARLFIHTSRFEGMPLAVLEAMALGRPVLVTPGTNLAREVAEADAGIVVSLDVDAIAVGLKRAAALTNHTLDVMGHNARSMIATKFVWNAVAGNFRREYESALVG